MTGPDQRPLADAGMATTPATGRDGGAAGPGDLSLERFDAGYNCAEAVLRGCNEALELGLDPAAYGLGTPFGGGFGGARSACGAVTGGLMALGVARGRTDVEQPAGPGATAGRQLHDRFVDRFGTVCCQELTSRYDWNQPERRQACGAYVRFAAETVGSIVSQPQAG